MPRDWLDEAVCALRDNSPVAPANVTDAGVTRLLRDVRTRKRRHTVAVLLGAQVMALLFGFGAWAKTSGRLEAFIQEWSSATTNGNAPGKRFAIARINDPAENQPSFEAKPDALPRHPSPTTPAPAPASSPGHRRALSQRPLRTPVQPPLVALSTPPASNESLYEQAHAAHFVKRDWSTAINLWQRYLQSPGERTLAIEARFNLALALVHEGRMHQAAQELLPFAEGEYGTYRTIEAKRLLQFIQTQP